MRYMPGISFQMPTLRTLANGFYETYILETSGCGNFGSNLTSPYSECNGTSKTPSLNGRDVAMLEKRFFGGLKLSQALVDWATTDGANLGETEGSRHHWTTLVPPLPPLQW